MHVFNATFDQFKYTFLKRNLTDPKLMMKEQQISPPKNIELFKLIKLN